MLDLDKAKNSYPHEVNATYLHEVNTTNIHKEIIEKRYEKKISDYERKLCSLACQLSKTEELERRSIMRELHDGTVQDLAGVQIKLGVIRKGLPNCKLTEIIDDVRCQINITLQNIRSMIYENSPPDLKDKGLKHAIGWLVDNAHNEYNLRVDFTSESCIQLLDHHYQAFIYRTIRELLINIIKHADATRANIGITKFQSNIKVCVSDNGMGFIINDIEAFERKKHFGLRNINERTTFYGGHLGIKSRPCEGTHVTIILPFEPPGV